MHAASANGLPAQAQATTTAPVAAQARVLRGVRKGRIAAPMRVLLYSVEGIGKTTWASEAPNPIYLCKEAGTEQLDVARLPEPTHWKDAPADAEGLKRDCFSLVLDLLSAPHDYQSLVVDTLDWIEPLLFKWVCANSRSKKGLHPVDSINEAFGGYGKGYDVAVDQFRDFISLLDRLRVERQMHIVLLAHADVAKFNNPEGEDFDMYGLKMNKKTSGLWREWCDAVLFAKAEKFDAVKKSDEEAKKKRYAVGSMTRLVYTQARPFCYAKNRFCLPDVLPLQWAAFYEAVKKGMPASIEELIKRINDAASLCDADIQSKTPGMVDRSNGDPEKLVRVLNFLQSQTDAPAESTEP